MICFLHSAADREITAFDTAGVYGPITNEEPVGEVRFLVLADKW